MDFGPPTNFGPPFPEAIDQLVSPTVLPGKNK